MNFVGHIYLHYDFSPSCFNLAGLVRDIILFQSKLVQENKLFWSDTAPCHDPEHCGVHVYVIAMPGELGHYSNVATGWT